MPDCKSGETSRLGERWGNLSDCCDDLTFMFGKIVKHNPRASKYNYDVSWEPGPPNKHGVAVGDYYADTDAPPVPGNWRYLRKMRARRGGTRTRAPPSDTESDDGAPPRRRARQ